MRARSRRRPVAAAVLAVLALTACTTVASDTPDDIAAGVTTVTFRLWDEGAVLAYEESFDAFTATHPDIQVEVEHVARAEYRSRGAADLRAGDMADIFWTDASALVRHAEHGDVRSVDDAGLEHDEWEPAAADLFTRDGELWAVPQLWESVALYVNTGLTEGAGVDPSALAWAPRVEVAPGPADPPGVGGSAPGDGSADAAADDDPGADGADADASGAAGTTTEDADDAATDVPPSDDADTLDTLLPAATALTRDSQGRTPAAQGFDPDATEQYGFNAEAAAAVYRPFLAQNSADIADGPPALASVEGAEVSRYLVELVDVHHVAPPGEQTNADPDLTRELFIEGRLALFQSSSADLARVAEAATFRWELAPPVAGPEGAMSAVDGVAAALNADATNMEAALLVLGWLGSSDGQAALAGQGVAFPAAVRAEPAFVDYWAAKGVDVAPFLDAARGPTVPAPLASHVEPDPARLAPVLRGMLDGTIPDNGVVLEDEPTSAASG